MKTNLFEALQITNVANILGEKVNALYLSLSIHISVQVNYTSQSLSCAYLVATKDQLMSLFFSNLWNFSYAHLCYSRYSQTSLNKMLLVVYLFILVVSNRKRSVPLAIPFHFGRIFFLYFLYMYALHMNCIESQWLINYFSNN